MTAERRELPGYVVITPVRDEAAWLPKTIASVVAQSHRPSRWVIVDDASQDGTRAIADAAAARYPWIKVMSARSAGAERARGAPIVRAFNDGLAQVDIEYEFLVKLDGDLFLPSHCFEWLAEIFSHDPQAGIVGGRTLIPSHGRWKEDDIALHTVAGPLKAYRRDCFEEIGGLHTSMGWDGIDELAARARGWTVVVATELQILHYNPRGSRQQWWVARWEEGIAMRFMGYRAEFAIIRCGFRALTNRPRLFGGLVMLSAFLFGTAAGYDQVDDQSAIRELRREQRARLSRLRRQREADRPDGPAYWF